MDLKASEACHSIIDYRLSISTKTKNDSRMFNFFPNSFEIEPGMSQQDELFFSVILFHVITHDTHPRRILKAFEASVKAGVVGEPITRQSFIKTSRVSEVSDKISTNFLSLSSPRRRVTRSLRGSTRFAHLFTSASMFYLRASYPRGKLHLLWISPERQRPVLVPGPKKKIENKKTPDMPSRRYWKKRAKTWSEMIYLFDSLRAFAICLMEIAVELGLRCNWSDHTAMASRAASFYLITCPLINTLLCHRPSDWHFSFFFCLAASALLGFSRYANVFSPVSKPDRCDQYLAN